MLEEIIERNKKLCERYPYLIPRNVWTDEIDRDYDYSYIHGDYEIPIGWQKLFLQLCEDIRQPLIEAGYLDKFRFSQVKEKFNTLRCYTFGEPEVVSSILAKYEYISRFICQKCGKPAAYETIGWMASYCDNCIKGELLSDTNSRAITFDPVMKRIQFSHDKTETVEYDCSDIWNRLYEVKK